MAQSYFFLTYSPHTIRLAQASKSSQLHQTLSNEHPLNDRIEKLTDYLASDHFHKDNIFCFFSSRELQAFSHISKISNGECCKNSTCCVAACNLLGKIMSVHGRGRGLSSASAQPQRSLSSSPPDRNIAEPSLLHPQKALQLCHKFISSFAIICMLDHLDQNGVLRAKK